MLRQQPQTNTVEPIDLQNDYASLIANALVALKQASPTSVRAELAALIISTAPTQTLTGNPFPLFSTSSKNSSEVPAPNPDASHQASYRCNK